MKIKVTHFADSKFYYFNLPIGIYIINGIRIVSSDPQKHFTSENLPEMFSVHTGTRLTRYQTTDGLFISVAEYLEKLEKLEKFKKLSNNRNDYNDYEDDLEFDDLDNEYEYKKFKRDHSPVYEKYTNEIPVEIDLVESILNVDDDFITPIFSVDSTKPHLFTFDKAAFEKKVIRDWLAKIGTENTVEWATHSHIKYIKLNGKYPFYNYIGADNVKPLLLTLNDIRVQKKNITTKIEALLEAQFCLISKLEHVTVAEIISKIRDSITSGKSMSNTNGKSKYNVYDVMSKPLLECIEQLEKSVLKHNKEPLQ
jgi:CRISPR/Cas system CMR-associated protein Cmr5 small subunit